MFVTLNIVEKAMIKHNRCVFYLKDDKGDLVHGCEDKESPQEAFEELREYIDDCIGSYAIVELPKEAKGKSSRGGNKVTLEEAKFTYKIKLGSNNNRNDSGNNGGGSMGLIIQLMREQNTLSTELQRERSERALDEFRRDMKELKKKGGNDPVEKFAEIIYNKYTEAERVKGIAREVRAKHAPQPEPEPEGTINAEQPHPQKEKLKGAINKLKGVDPEFVENIDFLADYAAKNPEIYKEFIAGLKGGAV